MSYPSIIAIVPARKGSKRIPGKNTKLLNGKALIQWTIESAQQVSYISKLIVSTDDPEILKMKELYPKVVFQERPAHLCGDEVSGADPVVYVLNQQSEKYDYVLLLQPTSPLRTTEHIEGAILRCFESNIQQLVSVKKSIENLNHVVVREGQKASLLSKKVNLENARVLNGAIYLSKIDLFLKEKNFVTSEVDFFEMDVESSIDIDTPEDWLLAVKALEKRLS